MTAFNDRMAEAQSLINDLVPRRDAWLQPGPVATDTGLIEAKKFDLQARQAAAAFFRVTEDPVFADSTIPPMVAAPDRLARIDELVALGKCRALDDVWSGLARKLELAK